MENEHEKIKEYYVKNLKALDYLDTISAHWKKDPESLKFCLSYFYNVFQSGRFKGTKLLEIGSGATVHNVASASAFFTNITMSDYVENNCEELMKWLKGESTVTQLLDFPAEFEGYGSDLKSGREMIAARIRRNVKRVDRCDVLTEDILFSQSSSPETSPPFDVVMSCLCLEAAPKDYDEYKRIFKRINRMLRPGGGLFICGFLGGERWAIGEHNFNHIQINSEDLLEAVKEAAFGNVELKTYDRKIETEYMYEKLYCLVAEKL